MKKLISAIICVAILLLSVIPAYAAEASEPTGLNCSVLSSDRLSNETLVFYSYNIDSNCKAFYYLENLDTGETQRIWFKDYIGHPHSINVGSYLYKPMIGVSLGSSSGMVGGGNFCFTNVDAKYEKVRFRLGDCSSYFNADGTVTVNLSDYGEHTFNFTEQVVNSEAVFSSSLVFESGGAVNCVVPDAYGCVEIYVSKAIGRNVSFSTNFQEEYKGISGKWHLSSVGGKNRRSVPELITGNVDQNLTVNIDDVTELQLYLAKRTNLNGSAKRAADTNADTKINIDDVTALQAYLANKY